MTFNDLFEANKGLHLADLADLAKANADRCNEVFHPIDDWSPTDWACAMGGECGEVLNLVKKLRRKGVFYRDQPHTPDVDNYLYCIGLEVADMVIYADLLCQRLGISLEDAIREKFNIVSEETGSDIQL